MLETRTVLARSCRLALDGDPRLTNARGEHRRFAVGICRQHSPNADAILGSWLWHLSGQGVVHNRSSRRGPYLVHKTKGGDCGYGISDEGCQSRRFRNNRPNSFIGRRNASSIPFDASPQSPLHTAASAWTARYNGGAGGYSSIADYVPATTSEGSSKVRYRNRGCCPNREFGIGRF